MEAPLLEPVAPAAPEAPRWSRLAWFALGLAAVPTCVGQGLALVLAPMALVEIRVSRGREKGRLVALAALGAAAAWLVFFGSLAAGLVREWEREEAQAAEAEPRCAERLKRIGEALRQARLARAPGDYAEPSLPELVERGVLADPADLRCPADTRADADRGNSSYRLADASRRRPGLGAQRTVRAYEESARHRHGRQVGGNVLFLDGRVEWLTPRELDTALRQQGSRER